MNFPKELEAGNFRRSFIASERSRNISAAFLKISGRNAINQVRPYFALLYLLQGEGIFIDKYGKEYQLKPGHLVLRHPGKKHSVIRENDGEWIEFAIVFSREIYNFLVSIEIIDPEKDVLDVGIDQLTLKKLYKFIESLKSYTPKEFPLLMIKLQTLFYEVSHWSEKIEKDQYIEKKINIACQILSEDLDKKLNIPDCAKTLGLGYHHFRKEFRNIIGMSPKRYRVRRRIELAQDMIREDSLSLKEIGEKLGYPDFASFAKQYKKVTGIPPAMFRNNEYS